MFGRLAGRASSAVSRPLQDECAFWLDRGTEVLTSSAWLCVDPSDHHGKVVCTGVAVVVGSSGLQVQDGLVTFVQGVGFRSLVARRLGLGETDRVGVISSDSVGPQRESREAAVDLLERLGASAQLLRVRDSGS